MSKAPANNGQAQEGQAQGQAQGGDTVGVLCVDDNPRVADALRLKVTRAGGFTWAGHLLAADDLLKHATDPVKLVILDLDLPGLNPFTAMRELAEQNENIRVVVFSGHVRRDLVDRVLSNGAWGYVSKNDGEDELIDALRRVLAGELAMSPEVRSTWDM